MKEMFQTLKAETLRMVSLVPVPARVVILFLTHMSLQVFSHICFKLSTGGGGKVFIFYQAAGNFASFISVLALTGLYHLIPMHIAYPISQGLAMIGVQILAARIIFSETIMPLQWLGTFLVIAGMAMIGTQGEA